MMVLHVAVQRDHIQDEEEAAQRKALKKSEKQVAKLSKECVHQIDLLRAHHSGA